MFASAAVFMQTFWLAAQEAAKWLATKALILAIMMLVLPFVLKGVIIWGFEWFAAYGREAFGMVMGAVGSLIGSSGEVVQSSTLQLTGIGGYLAIQTGLIDYASIIFTGWGLYWIVAVLAKTPGVGRL